MVNFPKLLDETYWSEEELEVLYVRFKRVSGGAKTITEDQFLQACGRPDSFIAKRLFAVFCRQATERGINGMDFEAFASGTSTFCPNAPLQQKMFVCFKVFDMGDVNLITRQDLQAMVQAHVDEFNIPMNAQQIKAIVDHTIQSSMQITRHNAAPHTTLATPEATRPSDGITFDNFKVLFIRCHGLMASFTLETWHLLDKPPPTNKVSMFMKQQLLRKSTPSPNLQRSDPNSSDGPVKNPSLRAWYRHSVHSAPVSPSKTPNLSPTASHRRAVSLKNPHKPIIAPGHNGSATEDILQSVARGLENIRLGAIQRSTSIVQKSPKSPHSPSSLRASPRFFLATNDVSARGPPPKQARSAPTSPRWSLPFFSRHHHAANEQQQ